MNDPQASPSLFLQPDKCGCYTWKHEGTACELQRLLKLNADHVRVIEALTKAVEKAIEYRDYVGDCEGVYFDDDEKYIKIFKKALAESRKVLGSK